MAEEANFSPTLSVASTALEITVHLKFNERHLVFTVARKAT
jgi:hypothetical protein